MIPWSGWWSKWKWCYELRKAIRALMDDSLERMVMKSSVVTTSQRLRRQLFGWIFEVNALLQISIFIRTSTDCILSGWALWWRKRQSREWRWRGLGWQRWWQRSRLGWQRWWRRSRLGWQWWWMMMTMMAGTSSNSELRQICKSFFRLIALQDKSHSWSSWWW